MATAVVLTIPQEGSKFNDVRKLTSALASNAAEFFYDPAKLDNKKKVLDALEQLKVYVASADFQM